VIKVMYSSDLAPSDVYRSTLNRSFLFPLYGIGTFVRQLFSPLASLFDAYRLLQIANNTLAASSSADFIYVFINRIWIRHLVSEIWFNFC